MKNEDYENLRDGIIVTAIISINEITVDLPIITLKEITLRVGSGAVHSENFCATCQLPKTKKNLQIANSFYNEAGENKVIIKVTTTKGNYQLCCTDIPLYSMTDSLTTKEYTRLFIKRFIFNSLKTTKAKLYTPIEIFIKCNSIKRFNKKF